MVATHNDRVCDHDANSDFADFPLPAYDKLADEHLGRFTQNPRCPRHRKSLGKQRAAALLFPEP